MSAALSFIFQCAVNPFAKSTAIYPDGQLNDELDVDSDELVLEEVLELVDELVLLVLEDVLEDVEELVDVLELLVLEDVDELELIP